MIVEYTICFLLGLLGGATYLILGMYKNGLDWFLEDKKKFLHLVLAGISAIVALLAGLPNHLNSFLVGYVAPAFLETITSGSGNRAMANYKKQNGE